MDKLGSSDGKSSASSGEMTNTSWHKQWTIVNDVKMQVEAMQNLVKGQKRVLEQLRSQFDIDNNVECGNSDFLSDISYHVEKIRKVISDEGESIFSLTPSLLSPSCNTNQAEDVAVVVEKALNNSVVLRTIMNNLHAQDLLHCRLVTKSWKEEADIQLLSCRLGNKVKFWWDEETENYENRHGTIKEFTECCYGDPHQNFPCSQFHIHFWKSITVSEETQADLFNFFSKCGHRFKSLYLECSINSAFAFKIMNKIIFEWTPNLKSLTFEFPCYYDKTLPENVQQMSQPEDDVSQISSPSLENLQDLCLESSCCVAPVIAFERCKPLVSRILASAPNLKRISDWYSSFTKEIVSAGKIRAVDAIEISSHSSMVPLYVDFSLARPQLTNLTLDVEEFLRAPDTVPYRDFFTHLRLILESSRLSLKTLELSHRLHVNAKKFASLERTVEYQGVKFTAPIVENLRELTLSYWESFEGGEGWILPRGSSFQVSFPRLKTLRLLSIKNEEKEYKIGSTDNPFSNHFNSNATVEKLIIKSAFKSVFPLEWIPQARVLYPNVRVLHLEISNNWMELPQLCSRIWKSWSESSLEELQVNVSCDHYKHMHANFAEVMDQTLTGFDFKACRMLRKRLGSKQSKDDEEIKRKPSISDMSNLKLFKLSGTLTGGFSLFSRVSVIHAFDPMKKRQNLRLVIN